MILSEVKPIYINPFTLYIKHATYNLNHNMIINDTTPFLQTGHAILFFIWGRGIRYCPPYTAKIVLILVAILLPQPPKCQLAWAITQKMAVQFSFVFMSYVTVYGRVQVRTDVQRSLVGVPSLLPPRGFRGSSSGCQVPSFICQGILSTRQGISERPDYNKNTFSHIFSIWVYFTKSSIQLLNVLSPGISCQYHGGKFQYVMYFNTFASYFLQFPTNNNVLF